MAISLYDVSVSNYLQTLGAASRFLDKAASHFREHGVDLREVVETRLFPDMLPFRYQVQSIAHHSLGTLAAFESGVFHPAPHDPAYDYPALQALLRDAQAKLTNLTPSEVNAREDAEVVFQAGPNTLRFTAPDFVLSFSLPNFHFHATTTYDILRSKGVPLGKRDYMGRVRLKG